MARLMAILHRMANCLVDKPARAVERTPSRMRTYASLTPRNVLEQFVACVLRLQPAEEGDVPGADADLLGQRDDVGLDEVAHGRLRMRVEKRQTLIVDRSCPPLEDGPEQAVLAAEVVLRHAVVALAGSQADLAHRDTVHATLGDELLRTVEQEDTRRCRLPSSGHARDATPLTRE